METFDGIHTIYEGDVQYPYADVGEAKLLHISAVNKENRRQYSYICPCCQKRLRPRLGEKNRHCFFHDKGSRCAMDKYIHDTAKRLLKEKFDSDAPFEVEMDVTRTCDQHEGCRFAKEKGYDYCTKIERVKYDLKQHYQQCLVETKCGEFIPDLMLVDETGKREPIFIEIWHKHKSNEAKINSNIKIIEIRLKKVDELQPLVENPITESDTVKFFNFKTVKVKPEMMRDAKLYKFYLYRSLKSYCTPAAAIHCYDYRTDHKKSSIVEITALNDAYFNLNEFWQYCLYISHQKGADVKDCYMCKHSRHNRESGPEDEEDIYCKALTTDDQKHICKHDFGKTCDRFEIDQKKFLNLKQRFYSSTLHTWKDESLVERPEPEAREFPKSYIEFEREWE